jgi:hypothetical protein|tara:strand:+ start:4602 stop:4805 length:204 start_codon:yes stop_codon:yes gene_type:complete
MKLIYQILSSIFIFDFLSACAVCYGSPDEPAVKAAQAGILFLLGVVSFVLSCFALFMYNLNKKSQEI